MHVLARVDGERNVRPKNQLVLRIKQWWSGRSGDKGACVCSSCSSAQMRMIRRAQEVTCHRAVPVATGAPTLIIVTVTGVTVTCCSDGASSSVVCL